MHWQQRRAKKRRTRKRCHNKINGGGKGGRRRYSTAILKRNRHQYSSDSFSIFWKVLLQVQRKRKSFKSEKLIQKIYTRILGNRTGNDCNRYLNIAMTRLNRMSTVHIMKTANINGRRYGATVETVETEPSG